MPFTSSSDLTSLLMSIFDRLVLDPQAVKAFTSARLIFRLQVSDPPAVLILNGRKDPPALSYTPNSLRPDLDLYLSADTLDQILRRQLRVRVAIATGRLKINGPVWKSLPLEDLFHRAQALYQQLYPSS